MSTRAIQLAEPPEPTEWCNVRFSVDVEGTLVELWISWECEIVSPAESGGPEEDRAIAFLDGYSRNHVLYLHQLLGTARKLYEANGGNDEVGELPQAKLRGEPTVIDGTIEFTIEVGHRTVAGRITETLAWQCSEPSTVAWATARHLALTWIVDHRHPLPGLGFDTTCLNGQLDELTRPMLPLK